MLPLPDELICLIMANALAFPAWPGVWIAVCRMVSRRARQLFGETAERLPPELRWLVARSQCRDISDCALCYHAPPWAGHPKVAAPLAYQGPGQVVEVHLRGAGVADAGLIRLVRALHAQSCVKLLELSYNPFGLPGFRALTEELWQEACLS